MIIQPVAHRRVLGDVPGLLAPELSVLEIDVVHNLRDRAERRVVRADPVQHHFERTLVALMRVLRLDHVEAKPARLSVIVLRGDEFEPSAGVNEAADQPGASDAIDVNASARDPNLASHVF